MANDNETDSPTNQSDDITAQIRAQNDTIDSVESIKKNFKKDSATRKKGAYFESRLNSLQQHYQKFYSRHELILKYSRRHPVLNPGYWDRKLPEVFEEMYIETYSEIREAEIDYARMTVSAVDTTSPKQTPDLVNVEARLPEIKLPTFGGDFIEWPSFREIFVSRIHDSKLLTDLQRFHYLKCASTGEAEVDIRHIAIIGENYATAWELLNKQYNNKIVLFSHYMNVFDKLQTFNGDDANALRRFIQTARSTFNALEKLEIDVDKQSDILAHYLLAKLPKPIRLEWDRSVRQSSKIPSVTEILSLLDEVHQMLVTSPIHHSSSSTNSTNTSSYSSQSSKTKPRPPARQTNEIKTFLTTQTHAHRSSKCSMCDGAHSLRECSTFLNLSVRDRKKQVEKNRLCFNCLGYNHLLTSCSSTRNCNKCGGRHHTLLHFTNADVSNEANPVATTSSQFVVPTGQRASSAATLNVKVARMCQRKVLMATALIRVRSSDEQWFTLRAVLDQCSENSLITERALQLLRLPKIYENAIVKGAMGVKVGNSHSYTALTFASQYNNEQFTVKAWSIKKITDFVPSQRIARGDWPHIDEILEKFWQMEDIEPGNHQTNETEWCEKFYEQTHERLTDGSYCVRLPLKTLFDPDKVIGASREIAARRFRHLERRFLREPTLKEEYFKAIDDYVQKGQMTVANTTEDEHKQNGDGGSSYTCCYLPHHAVVKESSSTTKLRVFYDGSAATSNGTSLNEILVVGPSLQTDIVKVLLNFRAHEIVFTADIQQMYRCIAVKKADAQYQRILWRSDSNQEFTDYVCNVVMFGTASAPYTAIRTMHQLANDEKQNFPLAYDVVLNDMYVDDICTGSHSLKQAVKIQREINEMLRSGGFELRKWATNHAELLKDIPVEHREIAKSLEFSSNEGIKTLGMYWSLETDEFNFQSEITSQLNKLTKRKALSLIARAFDPLGLINAIVTRGKIMMKPLWLDCNEELPEILNEQWIKYFNDFININFIRVPRWLNLPGSSPYQLHLFCDASIDAYAAVAYVRTGNSLEEGSVSLIMAKSKVTPKLPVTIPRLEISSADLAVKLLKSIKKHLRMILDESNIFMWTDSMVALATNTGQAK